MPKKTHEPYLKKAVPFCPMCGGHHYNWPQSLCEPRRNALAERMRLEQEQFRAEQEILTAPDRGADQPYAEMHPERRGLRPFGDRLSTMVNQGGNLTQIRPARPQRIFTPGSE